MQNVEKVVKTTDLFDSLPYFILLALLFLTPFFLVPSLLVPLSFGKSALVYASVAVTLILWALSVLRKGKLIVPNRWISAAVLLVPIAYLVSSIFSPSTRTSIMGNTLMTGTFYGVLVLSLLTLFVSVVVKKNRQILNYYTAFIVSAFVVALFQILRLIFGPGFLSLGVLGNSGSTIVGRWNDLGLFFGLVAIISLVALALLKLKKTSRILTYVALAVSFFFLALVNFTPVWYVVGIVGFFLLVYMLSVNPAAHSVGTDSPDENRQQDGEGSTRTVFIPAVVTVALAVVFIVAGSLVGGFLSDLFSISQVEVRPSWGATYSVADQTLRESPALGAGPNRFTAQWMRHKPEGINETAFWNFEFNTGIGFIPSSPTTVGIVGFASWIILLGYLIYLGVKSVFARGGDNFTRFFVASSFLATLFLWTFLVIYTPGVGMTILTFVFTGLFFSSMHNAGTAPSHTLALSRKPLASFATTLLFTVIVVLGVLGVYGVAERIAGEVFFQRAFAARNAGDFTSAERDLTRATRLYPSDLYHRTLADVQMGILGAVITQQDAPDNLVRSQFQQTLGNAITNARRATEIDENNYNNWFVLGNVYGSVVPLGIEGAYENAKESYDRAINLNPGPDIFLSIARLEAQRGNLAGAREYIGKSIDEKGNYIPAIFTLSQIETVEGNVQNAIRAVEAAALISPNDPTIFFQLGLLEYNTGDNTSAISVLETAVSLNPVYANAQYFLGLAYERVGRIQDAITQFEAVEQTNPDNQEVKFILDNLRNGRAPFEDAEPPINDEPEGREEPPIEE